MAPIACPSWPGAWRLVLVRREWLALRLALVPAAIATWVYLVWRGV